MREGLGVFFAFGFGFGVGTLFAVEFEAVFEFLFEAVALFGGDVFVFGEEGDGFLLPEDGFAIFAIAGVGGGDGVDHFMAFFTAGFGKDFEGFLGDEDGLLAIVEGFVGTSGKEPGEVVGGPGISGAGGALVPAEGATVVQRDAGAGVIEVGHAGHGGFELLFGGFEEEKSGAGGVFWYAIAFFEFGAKGGHGGGVVLGGGFFEPFSGFFHILFHTLSEFVGDGDGVLGHDETAVGSFLVPFDGLGHVLLQGDAVFEEAAVDVHGAEVAGFGGFLQPFDAFFVVLLEAFAGEEAEAEFELGIGVATIRKSAQLAFLFGLLFWGELLRFLAACLGESGGGANEG